MYRGSRKYIFPIPKRKFSIKKVLGKWPLPTDPLLPKSSVVCRPIYRSNGSIVHRYNFFLLNQVLRCPGGVGDWAASYVQTEPDLDHAMIMLSAVLSPVTDREQFLTELKVTSYTPQTTGEDNKWTVLDSEGEEDEDPERSWSLLRENDLVLIFTQIPVDFVFETILKIDPDSRYDPDLFSEHSFLNLFAFSTKLVGLLRRGLQTYNTPRFRNFAKRLGQLIRHAVEFVSDHLRAFRALNKARDEVMLARIQVEYDQFFLRAVKSIFSAQKLGAWQYLALIPYGVVSVRMLWKVSKCIYVWLLVVSQLFHLRRWLSKSLQCEHTIYND